MTNAAQERRRFKRHNVACPIKISDGCGGDPVETTTVNVSRGGALLVVPADRAPECKSTVEVQLSAQDTEGEVRQFSCRATVVRHEHVEAAGQTGVALKFDEPLPLSFKR
ncbi:MAG: PilZ domain-containing protein [Planctomycetota bacterium]|jgi:c-di-GMP-binding flagellar brake protein YcgR